MKDKQSYLTEIKRIFLKKHYKFFKKKSILIQSNFRSFYYTTFVGFFLIVPLTRKIFIKIISSKFNKKKIKENFIEGEFEEINKDDDKTKYN